MAVKKVYLNPIMSVEESDKKSGVMLEQADCLKLFAEDVDVYDKESNLCIAKFRKQVIPANVQRQAFDSLLIAAKTSANRGTAGGAEKGKTGVYRVKQDGTISNTWHSTKVVSSNKLRKNGTISKTSEAENLVESGIVGYFDRTSRMPFCRLTAFNQHHLEKFKKAYPIIKFVDKKYEELMPKLYKLQREVADNTSKDFVIPGTAFTTVTVNKNWQTAVHKDKGDFAQGFGNLVALRKGKYTGGHFVVVRWGVGFDLQNGDLLLVDVHQWHGNTPIVKDNKKVVRLSLVMYYREKMRDCGTMAQELHRAKNKKHGEPIKGKITDKASPIKRRGVDKKDIRKK